MNELLKTLTRVLPKMVVLIAMFLLAVTGGCLKSIDTGLDEQSIQGELEPGVPAPWRLYGPQDGTPAYDFIGAVDTANKRSGTRSACFLAIDVTSDDQARLTQRFTADKWRGKRVRFSAYLKSYKLGKWGGLWMRIDTDTRQAYAFDDSEDRHVSGTTEWELYSVVLDVPENAATIYLGAHMFGRGQVWMDNCSFEEVGNEVKATDRYRLQGGFQRQYTIPEFLNDEPINLDFEENETM